MRINVGTYVSSDAEKGFFSGLVDHTAGSSTGCAGGESIITALATTTDECIKTWVHAQHGWIANSAYGKAVDGGLGGGTNGSGTGFYGNDPNPQPANGGRAKGGRQLDDLAAAIKAGTVKFCNPCRIYIYGCQMSNTGTFAARLSGIIPGSKVFAGNGKVSTAHSNGDPGTSTDPWRAEGGWDTFEAGAQTNTETGPTYISPTTTW